MKALMGRQALTVRTIFDRLRTVHAGGEVVDALASGSTRTTYGELADRVLRLVTVLRDLGVQPGDRVATFNIDGTSHLSEYDFGFVDENGFTPIALSPAGPSSVFGSYRFEGGSLVNFALRESVSGSIYSIADPLDYADQLFLDPIDPSRSVNPPVSYTYYNSLLLEWDLDHNGSRDVGYTLTTANNPFDGLAPQSPAPVPLPASFFLFGGGLAGFSMMWKRLTVKMI